MSKLTPIKRECPPEISFCDIKIAIAYLEVRNHLKNKKLSYKDDYALNANNTEFQSTLVYSNEDGAKITVSNLAQFALPSKCAPKLKNLSEREDVENSNEMHTVPPVPTNTNSDVVDITDQDDVWSGDELFSQNLDQLNQQMSTISEDDELAQNIHQLDAVLSLSTEPLNTTAAHKTDKHQYISALDRFKYVDIKKSPSYNDSCLNIKEEKQCSSDVTSTFSNGHHPTTKSEYASVKSFTSPKAKSIYIDDLDEAEKQGKPSNKRKLPDWMKENVKSDCKTKSKIVKKSFLD